MARQETEEQPERLRMMRKAARLWNEMDLKEIDSQDYYDLYVLFRKIYLKYDP